MKEKSGPAPFGNRESILGKHKEPIVKTIAEPQHADTQKLIAYWHACAARGGLKLGRDLPAAAVARLMSKLMVFEPTAHNSDFRIRLAGTGMMRRFGEDISGQLLSAVYSNPSFDRYRENLITAMTTGLPLVIDVLMTEGPNRLFHFEHVFVPVMSYDGNDIWAVTGTFYFD